MDSLHLMICVSLFVKQIPPGLCGPGYELDGDIAEEWSADAWRLKSFVR